jgi:hypothetical protein
MIWGCITSKSKGLLVVFEKDWGSVNGEVYRQRIVLVIYEYKET